MSEQERRFSVGGNTTRGMPEPPAEEPQEIRGQLGLLENELEALSKNLDELCQRILPVLDTRPTGPQAEKVSETPQSPETFSDLGNVIFSLRAKVKTLARTTTSLTAQVRI